MLIRKLLWLKLRVLAGISVVYGSPHRSSQTSLWEQLENFSNHVRDRPWTAVGDFNVVLDSFEKEGSSC